MLHRPVTTLLALSMIGLVATAACRGDSDSDSQEGTGGLGGADGGSAPQSGGAETGGDATGGLTTEGSGGDRPTGGAGGSAGTGGNVSGGGGVGASTGGGGTSPTGGTAAGGTGGSSPTGGAASGGSAGQPQTGGTGGSEGGSRGVAGSEPTGGDGGGTGAAQSCRDSGGTVVTGLCCESSGHFPSSCVTGPCGCAPENSHEVQICRCPTDYCFDGWECVLESPSAYLLWTARGGAAGTGPAMELLEDGTLRLWSGVGLLVPHDTAGWDLELTLTPEENGELVQLLLDVDFTRLPHETSWVECDPAIYFEAPGEAEALDMHYGQASGLEPEFDSVYAWLESYYADHAATYSGPWQYCEF